MKVVICLCGLLRLEEEPCILCEGDDLDDVDDFVLDGLRAEAGDDDDTRRKQFDVIARMDARRH